MQVGVKVTKGERMQIPENTHPTLTHIMTEAWKEDPNQRITFDQICDLLTPLADRQYTALTRSKEYENAYY